MSDFVFKRVDMRYLATALVNEKTHDGITSFEMGLSIETTGSKPNRANDILKYIFGRPDQDDLVLSLLDYLYVESYADTTATNASYWELKQRVLDPRGVELSDDGFRIAGRERGVSRPAAAVRVREPAPEPIDRLGPTMAPRPRANPGLERDTSKVFVVHGRDRRPVDVLELFLQHIGLHVLSWPDAVHLTGETQPHTYDVVRAGMDACAAIIVVFSPDDLAKVRDEFSTEDDPERTPQGQARQNVLLEAGMAFATARTRTVFVKSATTREISDIAGFNWVKLDGRWDSRQDLRQRLETAGAAVRTGSFDLQAAAAGPFKVED